MNFHFEDFTEPAYRELLRLAKGKWTFRRFAEYSAPGRMCLWRHDVDVSPQRALRLAQIEADEGVIATYEILLHSTFYSALEREVRDITRKIAALGHDIGLHFDPRFYDQSEIEEKGLESLLVLEKEILERACGVSVTSFSFHNPDGLPPTATTDDDVVAGMVNARGITIKRNFAYCSDSNGYWRYRRLREVLESGQDERLLVLTHAEWWTPGPMTPRDRIQRCIDGRAAWMSRYYDDALKSFDRKNIT